jgi:hypothetical protein
MFQTNLTVRLKRDVRKVDAKGCALRASPRTVKLEAPILNHAGMFQTNLTVRLKRDVRKVDAKGCALRASPRTVKLEAPPSTPPRELSSWKRRF